MSSQPEQPAAAAHSSHVYASFGSERPDAAIEAGIAGLNDFSDANIKQIISIAVEFLQSPQVSILCRQISPRLSLSFDECRARTL